MAALEASVQAGLLAGVGIAALTDTLFRGSDPARLGLGLSGILFGVAGVASWLLVQRHMRMKWRVQELEVVPAGAGIALLRVMAAGPAGAPAPALLLDDGGKLHRLDPLPAGRANADGPHQLGYGVPQALLDRAAVALDTGRGRVRLSVPQSA